jgi:hypothetical protein
VTVATREVLRQPAGRSGLVIRDAKPSESYYGGWLVGRIRGSRLCQIPVSTAPRKDMIIEGVCSRIEQPPFTASSSADSNGVAIDSITQVKQTIRIDTAPAGPFDTGAGVNEITADSVGLSCYAYDNNTLYLTDSNGTLPRAGTVHHVDTRGKVWCSFDNKSDDLALDTPPTGPTVRCVVTSLPANTVTAGVMTADATGAWSSQDGKTLALGDEVLIPEGTTNLDNDYEAGPWVVSVLGATSVYAVLRRPSWWAHGAAMPLGAKVAVAEGTIYGGTTWRSDAAKGSTIGTTAPAFWPEFVCTGVTFASGTIASAVTTLPVKSATKSQVTISSTPTAAPHSSTRYTRISSLTVGPLGTCSINAVSESAPGTTNASDVGTYTISVRN